MGDDGRCKLPLGVATVGSAWVMQTALVGVRPTYHHAQERLIHHPVNAPRRAPRQDAVFFFTQHIVANLDAAVFFFFF